MVPRVISGHLYNMNQQNAHHHHHHHHHHHVPEGLGVFPVPWSSKWSWSLHLFFGRPMFLRPFGLYCSACFGILFLSILCTCCSHFFWYCFISTTIFYYLKMKNRTDTQYDKTVRFDEQRFGKLKVATWNVRGIAEKKEELQTEMLKRKMDKMHLF